VLSAVLGFLVRQCYLSVPGVHDDRTIEWLIGEQRLGRLSWRDMLTTSQSGQVVLLGLLEYRALLDVFGQHSNAFGLHLHLAHSLTAGAIYLLCRTRMGWFGALVASLFYASLAIGRWDNTLLWRANVEIALAIPCWVASLWGMERYRQSGAIGWAMVSLGSMAGALAHWNVGVLLLPSLLLLWWCPGEPAVRQGNSLWLWGWVGLVLLGMVIVGRGISAAEQGIPHDGTRIGRWLFAASTGPSLFAVVAGDLIGWGARGLGSEGLFFKWMTLLTLVLFGLGIATRPARWLVGVVCISVVGYATAVAWMRADLGSDIVLTSGRYYTLPLLSLSLFVGAGLDGLNRWITIDSVRRCGALILVFLAGLHLHHQREIAFEAERQFGSLWSGPLASYEMHQRVLRDLAEKTSPAHPILMADLPLDIPPVPRPYALSTLAAVMQHELQGRIECRPIASLSLAEWGPARQRLVERSAVSDSTARDWLSLIRVAQEDARALVWLERRARDRHRVVRIPPLVRKVEGREYRLRDWARVLMGEGDGWVDWDGTPADAESLREWMGNASNGEAQTWRRWLAPHQGAQPVTE
jgi:hypothetical protein